MMELRFEPKPMQYLCRILHETRYQEETMDTIVPDSCPDVERVLCGNAVVMTRSKECRAGAVTISGGIRAGVMYMAEGEKIPRHLDLYMPFTVKAESGQLTEDSRILFCADVKSVDVRMLNSRKLMVRVNLCWTLTAYGTCEQTLYTLEEPPVSLQTYTVEYPMLLPAETAERSFQMTEDISLPGNRPLTGEIYQFVPKLELTERRVAGNKAVFKGIVHLHVLYGSQDSLAAYETELPFSQYCELTDVYDEDDMNLYMTLTGCELEQVSRQEGEGLLLSLHLLAQCVVHRKENVMLVEDAYCLDGELMPKWQEYSFANRLDKQVLSRTVRDSREGDVTDVAAAWVSPDHAQLMRTSSGVEITAPCLVQVLYYDTNGDLQFMSFRSEGKETVNLAENATCHVRTELTGNLVAIPTGNGVELRYPVSMTVESFAENGYRTLCGGEIKQTSERRRERPAVIVRRTRSGETLWDIAKASGTTVEKIRSANHMEQDVTEAGILLIPT